MLKVLLKGVGPCNARTCYQKAQSTWLGEPLGKEGTGANLTQPGPAATTCQQGQVGLMGCQSVCPRSPCPCSGSRDLDLNPGFVTY